MRVLTISTVNNLVRSVQIFIKFLNKSVIIVTRQSVEDIVICSYRQDTQSKDAVIYSSRQDNSSRQDTVINSFHRGRIQ